MADCFNLTCPSPKHSTPSGGLHEQRFEATITPKLVKVRIKSQQRRSQRHGRGQLLQGFDCRDGCLAIPEASPDASLDVQIVGATERVLFDRNSFDSEGGMPRRGPTITEAAIGERQIGMDIGTVRLPGKFNP